MKVLITGGAGFIGSHIADAFLAENQVYIVDDLSTGSNANISSDVVFHKIDIRNPECAELITELEPDLVIHAAAQMSVRTSMSDPTYDVDVNLCGLVNILQALPKNKLPFFVFLSTGGAIYGEQEEFPCTENHPTRPISVYGASKLASEIYLQLWQRVYGMHVAILRLANVYGPRQNPHGEAGVVAIFCNALSSGQPVKIFGDGSNTRDYIHVSDVVAAVRKASINKVQGIFNIGTGKESSVKDLLNLIADHLQKPVDPEFYPARIGEQLRSCISPKHAQMLLNWQAEKDLTTGLIDTLAWSKTNLK